MFSEFHFEVSLSSISLSDLACEPDCFVDVSVSGYLENLGLLRLLLRASKKVRCQNGASRKLVGSASCVKLLLGGTSDLESFGCGHSSWNFGGPEWVSPASQKGRLCNRQQRGPAHQRIRQLRPERWKWKTRILHGRRVNERSSREWKATCSKVKRTPGGNFDEL